MEDALILGALLFGAGFFFGYVYCQVKTGRDLARAAYLALSPEEKLIVKLEENMYVGQIRHLLDTARFLEFARASDGVTPIIATTRWVKDVTKNYQNGGRRYRALWEIVQRLPADRRKPAINARDQRGRTALMYAAEQSDARGVSLLMHLGADPELRDLEGRTAADLAAAWPHVVSALQRKEDVPAFPDLLKRLQTNPNDWP